MAQKLLPAAQYLRMSTDRQIYSMENQAQAIRAFCTERGYAIVQTYQDAGRSGVTLRQRNGLRQLLREVVAKPIYRAIIVYDVSRWGRFQDVDESAHYEFLCRSAGVPVLYCAENFNSEITMVNAILKSLKRVMAAEYSRDLGERCYRGQKRIIELGFKGGGMAPFGLHRLLVGSDGSPKQVLREGEGKALQSDHVILVPGTREELEIVRRIFRWVAEDGWTIRDVTRRLIQDGVPCKPGYCWERDMVSKMLRNEKYLGINVWGKTTGRLYGRVTRVPEERWIRHKHALTPIIDAELFRRANDILASRYWSDERLLDGLRRVLKEEGAVTQHLLECRKGGPKFGAVTNHFGSLQKALALIGYEYKKNYQVGRKKGELTRKLHEDLIKRICGCFPRRVSTLCYSWSRRRVLWLDRKTKISIQICPALQTTCRFVWRVVPRSKEKNNITLCCLMDDQNKRIASMHLAPNLAISKSVFYLKPDDDWFKTTIKITSLRHMCAQVERLLRVH